MTAAEVLLPVPGARSRRRLRGAVVAALGALALAASVAVPVVSGTGGDGEGGAALGFFVGCLLLGIGIGALRAFRPGTVVAVAAPQGLTFPAGRALVRAWDLLGWAGLPSVLVLVRVLVGSVVVSDVFLLAGLALCAAATGWAAFRTLRPRPAVVAPWIALATSGVTVCPAGGRERLVRWADLPDPTGQPPLTGLLRPAERANVEHALGSDPAAVAAVIEHFRTDATRRRMLADPAAALAALSALSTKPGDATR